MLRLPAFLPIIISHTTWIALVSVGFWQLIKYSNEPGKQALIESSWPPESQIRHDSEIPVLLLFSHPECPCTKASIGELERLIPYIKDKIKMYVVLYRSSTFSNVRNNGDLTEDIQHIPYINVLIDDNGSEVNNFGVQTSGQVLLFDKEGALVFKGGITPERGHMGDSPGRSAILAFVKSQEFKNQVTTPVFGCSVRSPERSPSGFTL